MAADFSKLLLSFLGSTRAHEFATLLAEIGDTSDRDLGEPLGNSGLFWHPVNGDASNVSAINLATKAGRSLTERITNAQDAMLELRARKSSGTELPHNPREAAAKWFGRPVSGPDSGMFAWDYAGTKADRNIHVALLPSDNAEAPTIDVLDSGIGIRPADMPTTILSLRGGNKIKKFHLIGSFNQGGSSTLAFSEYVLYASRFVDDPSTIGFTVVRVARLGDAYKEDCYAYLACADSGGSPTVPSVQFGSKALHLYEGKVKSAPAWEHGTLCRHVAFKLPELAKPLQASPGNLYHFLHASLFDPLLPFRLLDLRESGKEKDELVSGSRNRLMKYSLKKKKAEQAPDDLDTEEGGMSELRLYRPMEFVAPHGESDPTIGIEYWVPLNFRKSKGKGSEKVLRSSSSELFAQRGWPIIGTLNGQNQGEVSASFIRKLSLGLVSRHIVVHIDASRVPNHIRRALFVSTRESFKDGPVITAVESVLARMLSEDEDLAKLERELGEMIVQKDNAKTEDEVKRQITKLLLDVGVKVTEDGPSAEKGGGEVDVVTGKKRPVYKKKEPLPTLPYPQVTKWNMVVPAEEMQIHIGDYESVLVETDADAQFDANKAIAIRSEPAVLEVGSKAPLSGGRVRWRLRTAEGATEGQAGKIIATITKPDGTQLIAERPFKVLAVLPQPARKSKGQVPPFDVFAIDPMNEEDRATWGTLWPDLADEQDPEKLSQVAYKCLSTGNKTVVYFNVLFPPFRATEDQFLQKSKTLAEMYRMQYKIWIGYHALLQESDSKDERAEAGDSELVERTLSEETQRVATMQAKQAAQVVELRKQALKANEEEAGS